MQKKSKAKKAAPKKRSQKIILDSLYDQPIDSAFSNMSDRLVKIQRDLLMPAIAFDHFGIQNTITFFGASRIKPPALADANLAAVQRQMKKSANPSASLKEKLKIALRDKKMSRYYEMAEELARRLQEWINIQKFGERDKYYIISGGGPGIMEAANKGAFKAGGRSIGLTITIPSEQRLNEYVPKELGINFHYFLMRKFWLLFFAKAIVVFPGGTGTFDEFFEVFTLMKTRKTSTVFPIVLFDREFWQNAVNFRHLIESDVITEADIKFFKYVDSVDEAYNFIIKGLEKRIKASKK
ncbi:MAG: LOG family protein [Opitutales bacterium]|nr:LOG family protein [Opitutales bacterium]